MKFGKLLNITRVAIAVLVLAAASAPPGSAQIDNNAPTDRSDAPATKTGESDNNTDWGWIGLLGLLGLAGFLPKNRSGDGTHFIDGLKDRETDSAFR